MKKRIFLALAIVLIAASLSADTTLFRYSGTLDYGDARTLDGGYVDQFAVNANAGTRIALVAVSVDFPPRLGVTLGETFRQAGSRGVGSVYAERVVPEGGSIAFSISAGSTDSGSYSIRVFEITEDRFVSKKPEPQEG